MTQYSPWQTLRPAQGPQLSEWPSCWPFLTKSISKPGRTQPMGHQPVHRSHWHHQCNYHRTRHIYRRTNNAYVNVGDICKKSRVGWKAVTQDDERRWLMNAAMTLHWHVQTELTCNRHTHCYNTQADHCPAPWNSDISLPHHGTLIHVMHTNNT